MKLGSMIMFTLLAACLAYLAAHVVAWAWSLTAGLS